MDEVFKWGDIQDCQSWWHRCVRSRYHQQYDISQSDCTCVPCYCILSRPLVKDRQVSSHRWRGWGGGSVVVKHALNDQICAFNTEYRYFCPHNIHLRASFGGLFKWRPFGQLSWAGTLKAGTPLGLVITIQACHAIPYYTTSHHSIPRHTIPHRTTLLARPLVITIQAWARCSKETRARGFLCPHFNRVELKHELYLYFCICICVLLVFSSTPLQPNLVLWINSAQLVPKRVNFCKM